MVDNYQEFEGYSSIDENAESLNSVDYKSVLAKLLGSWKRVAIYAVVFSLLGLVIGFSIPKRYTVVSKIAPELSSSATNRLSSLTTMLGMNANILGSTDAVYPMVYPDIIGSVPFIADLFSVEVPYVVDNEPCTITLYDYYRDYQKLPWWTASVNWVLETIKSILPHKKSELECVSVDPFKLTSEQYSVYKAMLRSISVELDKKTLSITTMVVTQDPVVSAHMSKAINANLKRVVTEYRTEKARKDVSYYESLYQIAQTEYLESQSAYASYADRNQNLSTYYARIETERLRNEANLRYQMYNNMSQQLQSARAKVQLETPVLAEIVPPSVPVKPSGPSKKKILLVFFMLGILVSSARILFKK